MNKKSILYILLDLVFLIVFNTAFFVLGGTDHPASVWISYAFIHISYIMVLITPFLTRKTGSAAIFGFSIYSISSVYFFAEFIIGLIFILISAKSYKAALIIQIILAGIYAIILLANLIANEQTADNEEERENEISYIKNAASRVKLLVGRMSDKNANREIERAYDELHSSVTKTVPEVRGIEADILDKIDDLENAAEREQNERAIAVAGEIINLTRERNRKIRSFY